MSIRSWLHVFAIIGLASLPDVAVSQQGEQNPENTNGAEAGQQAEPDSLGVVPALESIEAAIRELIREESEADRQHVADQTAQNIEAQTEMAEWAMEVAVAAIASAIFTLGGLFLIWRTLRVSSSTLIATQEMAKDARDIGEAQTVPYIIPKGATVDVLIREAGNKSPFVSTSWENIGNSPAYNLSVKFDLNIKNGQGVIFEGRSVADGGQSLIMAQKEQNLARNKIWEDVNILHPTDMSAESGLTVTLIATIGYTTVFKNEQVFEFTFEAKGMSEHDDEVMPLTSALELMESRDVSPKK